MHDPFPLSSENSDSEEQTAGMTPENIAESELIPARLEPSYGRVVIVLAILLLVQVAAAAIRNSGQAG